MRSRIRPLYLVAAGLFLALAAYSVSIGIEQGRLARCLGAYTRQNSETTAIRSGLVERESQAVRKIINDVFSASTPAEGRLAKRNYDARLRRIDALRAQNPVQRFNDERCDQYQEADE